MATLKIFSSNIKVNEFLIVCEKKSVNSTGAQNSSLHFGWLLKIMKISLIVIYIIGFLAILLTLLPFLRYSAWWIRIGDFPRLQIAVMLLLSVIAIFMAADPLESNQIIFIAALLLCAGYQLYRILPFLPGYPRQVEKIEEFSPDQTIKLLILNVFIENRATDRFLRLVEQINPDVILLAEPDEHWVREIAELEKEYTFTVKYPLDNAYGMAFYSRLELINPQLQFIIEEDIPSIHTGMRLASGDLIDFYCLHPRPPIPPENSRSTERDAELVIVGKLISESDAPTIVAGDLNDVAWSHTTKLFRKISGLLDPRIGRGLYSSFHADYPFLRFPLDHVFHTKHFRLTKLRRLPHIGSDHYPIFIALSYEKTAELTQEEPQPDADDVEAALEIVEDAVETLEAEKES